MAFLSVQKLTLSIKINLGYLKTADYHYSILFCINENLKSSIVCHFHYHLQRYW